MPPDRIAVELDESAEVTLPLHPWFWFVLGLVAAIMVAALILWIDATADDAPAGIGITAARPAAD
jgi:hypothetical protein